AGAAPAVTAAAPAAPAAQPPPEPARAVDPATPPPAPPPNMPILKALAPPPAPPRPAPPLPAPPAAETQRLMAASACASKNADEARAAYAKLTDKKSRALVRGLCRKSGITLEPKRTDRDAERAPASAPDDEEVL